MGHGLPLQPKQCLRRPVSTGSNTLYGASTQLPHSWSTAHDAYWQMRTERRSQSILVCCGAGSAAGARTLPRGAVRWEGVRGSEGVREGTRQGRFGMGKGQGGPPRVRQHISEDTDGGGRPPFWWLGYLMTWMCAHWCSRAAKGGAARSFANPRMLCNWQPPLQSPARLLVSNRSAVGGTGWRLAGNGRRFAGNRRRWEGTREYAILSM